MTLHDLTAFYREHGLIQNKQLSLHLWLFFCYVMLRAVNYNAGVYRNSSFIHTNKLCSRDGALINRKHNSAPVLLKRFASLRLTRTSFFIYLLQFEMPIRSRLMSCCSCESRKHPSLSFLGWCWRGSESEEQSDPRCS